MTDAKCEPPPEWRDRDGWHWVKERPDGQPECWEWDAQERGWWQPGGSMVTDHYIKHGYRYLGPCTPPAVVAALEAERDRLKRACSAMNENICQTLGAALGYPWHKDDQTNFPGATEADGVCVGDHVAESIAAEAAAKLATVAALVEALEGIRGNFGGTVAVTADDPRAVAIRAALAAYREAGR